MAFITVLECNTRMLSFIVTNFNKQISCNKSLSLNKAHQHTITSNKQLLIDKHLIIDSSDSQMADIKKRKVEKIEQTS